MKVIKSEFKGFCNGVSRSLGLLDEALRAGGSVFLSGEVVHNTIVTNEYKEKGVRMLKEYVVPSPNSKSTLVVAAHGMPRSQREVYEGAGWKIIDGTCPVVAKRLSAIENTTREVVLFAKGTEHSEVIALTNNRENYNVHIIRSDETLEDFVETYLGEVEEIDVHSQTTFPAERLKKYYKTLKRYFEDVELCSTPCNDCLDRQSSAEELAKEADVVLVVGSSHSSNANELVRTVTENGKRAFIVEDGESATKVIKAELQKAPFDTVGLISSASSSEKSFVEVSLALEKI